MEGCKDTTAEKAHSLYMPNIPHYANHLIRSTMKLISHIHQSRAKSELECLAFDEKFKKM